MQDIDSELTLPSVVASLPGEHRHRQLVLTLAFHPRVDRIGGRAELLLRGKSGSAVVGRLAPLFSRGHGPDAGDPLEDKHVSRHALHVRRDGEDLLIERPEGASRCRLLGRELETCARLDRAQLENGVPLMLGHTVVLLLRLCPAPPSPVPGGDDLGIWGSSAYMARQREQILRAAATEDDVLILGETGTGKELVAAAIHANSRRAENPLVTVNTAAIPAELAPAALFGSARGAFTGAERASRGYFQQAEGGSLFLDEIGDMPAGIQPQLLRALQQREVQSVGGAITRVDLRVISATDAPLDAADSDFRAALRHRLGGEEIHLLPLREHPEDIGELALNTLVSCSAARPGRQLLPTQDSSDLVVAGWAEFFHLLLRHRWPGNVRELINTCRQVAAASENQLTVSEGVRRRLSAPGVVAPGRADGQQPRAMSSVSVEELDRAWQESRYEPAGTARLLGVSRPSLYRRIEGMSRYRLAGQVGAEELRDVLRDCGGDSVKTADRLRVSHSALRTVLRSKDLEWY